MMINIPALGTGEGCGDGASHQGLGRGDVMLEAFTADELQELLKTKHGDHAVTAEGVELLTGEVALTDVSTYLAIVVVGAHPAIGERSGRHRADDGAIGVFPADRAGDDGL